MDGWLFEEKMPPFIVDVVAGYLLMEDERRYDCVLEKTWMVVVFYGLWSWHLNMENEGVKNEKKNLVLVIYDWEIQIFFAFSFFVFHWLMDLFIHHFSLVPYLLSFWKILKIQNKRCEAPMWICVTFSFY